MRKILAKELKIKFVETLNGVDNLSYENGNPFLIKIGGREFFIFLKNLSPAYFKNSDVTRVQLPYSEHFSKIFEAQIPFIILGYDIDNDTMACWNPIKVKDRLNAKSNVSLYSRNSLQSNIEKNEFKSGYLSNGEKIILFRRDNLQFFFEKISILFDENQLSIEINRVEDVTENYLLDKIIEIKDEILLEKVNSLLKKNRVLEAVEVCSNYYKGKYSNMTFKDWFSLINKLYKST